MPAPEREELRRVGASLLGDGLLNGGELRNEEIAAAARLGLSRVSGNAEYQSNAIQEVSDAERALQELRRDAMMKVVRSKDELDRAAREAAEEQEKRKMSQKIEQELEALREEMRRKESQEEERLRHLYRAVLDPLQGAGQNPRPNIIPSSVSMLGSAVEQHEAHSREALSCLDEINELLASSRPSSQSWRRPQPFPTAVGCKLPYDGRMERIRLPANHARQSYLGKQRKGQVSDESAEVQSLLKKNLAMLSQLERLGF